MMEEWTSVFLVEAPRGSSSRDLVLAAYRDPSQGFEQITTVPRPRCHQHGAGRIKWELLCLMN